MRPEIFQSCPLFSLPTSYHPLVVSQSPSHPGIHEPVSSIKYMLAFDLNQSGHLQSLIIVLVFCLKKHWTLGYLYSTHQRLIRQADLSFRWANLPTCTFSGQQLNYLRIEMQIFSLHRMMQNIRLFNICGSARRH